MKKKATKFMASMIMILAMVLVFVQTVSAGAPPEPYFNGFETDISGWDAFGGSFNPVRVASGTNGITSASGGWHAEAVYPNTPATNWGGYSSVFPSGGYSTLIDIYLDVNGGFVNDTRFDFTSAINKPDGSHRRDFVFNTGFYNDTTGPGAGSDRFVISASNNAGRANSYPKNPGRDPIAITQSGWYTFKHTFYDNGNGVLAVDLSILDASKTVIKTWTLSDGTDVIGSTVGGNRYGWFAANEFAFLAFDNTERTGVIPNQPPVADANGPYLVAVDQSVSLDGSGSSDPDGDPLNETWMVTGDLLGTITDSTFTAGDVAGITEVTLTVDDGKGGTATDSAMLVVYDPDGGFVTGGGWIDSPADAMAPMTMLVWDQDFSLDDAGWLDGDDEWYGDIVVADGTATFYGDSDSAPFSRFDGYRDVWPGTWTAEIDVYLDPAWPSGQGFDYSVAATGSDGDHQRDYIFHVTKDTSTGKLLIAGSNNTNFAPREDLENIHNYEVTTAGWYTLQHKFYESNGALAVDLNLVDSSGTVLFTETRFNATDTIPDEVGGNRYAWFTYINVADGIQVDNHQLYVPVSPTGRATFGFVSKYKKNAEVPEGNTEFQFQAGNLNFHSTSYDWLVVTGSDYAKFKGTGAINGEGEYKFMIWAGDNDPDTFRIKIWYEESGSEVVVYDNGLDQAIGGGSIVVHKK